VGSIMTKHYNKKSEQETSS